MQRTFAYRVQERLSFQAFADRLDLALNPPPSPVDPRRAVGHWTMSSVREILSNPKYAGHMVWNRRARKTNGGKANPPSAWVWSEKPTHEPLISLEMFITVHRPRARRDNARRTTGLNTRPDTNLFRTYLSCDLRDRRMNGKTRRASPYCVCAPKKNYIPKGHPTAGSFFVREDQLVDHLNEFLNQYVFGDYRRTLLAGRNLGIAAARDHEEKIAAVRRDIADIDHKGKRLVGSLELVDEPDQEMLRDINDRRRELREQQSQLRERLKGLEDEQQLVPNSELIESLPTGSVRVEQMPEQLARTLFEALRLEIRYNKLQHRATSASFSGLTLAAAQRTAKTAITQNANGTTHPVPLAFPCSLRPQRGTIRMGIVPTSILLLEG